MQLQTSTIPRCCNLANPTKMTAILDFGALALLRDNTDVSHKTWSTSEAHFFSSCYNIYAMLAYQLLAKLKERCR